MPTFITKHIDPTQSHKEIRVVADTWFDAEVALIEARFDDLTIEGELIEEIPFEGSINKILNLN